MAWATQCEAWPLRISSSTFFRAALIACIVSERPQAADVYKARLADLPGLSHVTIEVNPAHATGRPPLAA